MNRRKLDETIAVMYSNIEYNNTYMFYGQMLSQCSIKIDNILNSPAAVSFEKTHYNLYINPDIYDKYSLLERLAILKHEMLHILYNHVSRQNDKNHKEWNYATDCALNQDICTDHLPKDCINPKALAEIYGVQEIYNESAEFYYELIKDKKPINKDKLNTLDNHDKWEECSANKDIQKELTKNMIEKAVSETLKLSGNIPDKCSKWINIHSKKSEISWKKVLKNIISNKRTNSRRTIMKRDRRFSNRDDLKGKIKESSFELLVVCDVSMSMKDEAIIKTLQEVQHICYISNVIVNLIQVDTIAHDPEKLTKKTKTFNRKGNGGTLLSTALVKAKEHKLNFNAVVVLTDGGVIMDDIRKFNELNKKVIWLIEPNGLYTDNMNSGKMKVFKIKDNNDST